MSRSFGSFPDAVGVIKFRRIMSADILMASDSPRGTNEVSPCLTVICVSDIMFSAYLVRLFRAFSGHMLAHVAGFFVLGLAPGSSPGTVMT